MLIHAFALLNWIQTHYSFRLLYFSQIFISSELSCSDFIDHETISNLIYKMGVQER